jgi:phage terminase large subunit-like protein
MAKAPTLISLKNKAKRQGWLKWVRSEADERALMAGCVFDVKAGERVVEFFSAFLRHTEGSQFAGKPFDLMDWQRDDVAMPLFGWQQPSVHYGKMVRRYKKTYIQVPKKNGKSPFGAGIGLYMLVGDCEPGAKVFSAAGDKDQASIVHDHAIAMVDASPELSAACKINRSTHNIAYEQTGSFYRAISAEASGKEGLNANCVIADELHIWYGRAMWDTLKYAFRSRMEPLFFVITTAGDDDLSVCHDQYNYAKDVLKGTITDLSFLPFIAEASPTDDFEDPAIQRKANPSLGVTINPEDFNAELKAAQRSPAEWPSFLRYSFNIWTSSISDWIPAPDWKACEVPFTVEDLKGRDCYAGLDLSKTRDTTALVLVFPWEDERFRVLPFFWLPADTAIRQRGRVPYEVWADQGLITLVPGSVVEYDKVQEKIRWARDTFNLKIVAFDKWHGLPVIQPLQLEGIECEEFGQTMGDFAGPTADFERLILSRKWEHNGHAVLSWQMGNTRVKTDPSGNRRPIKPKPDDYRKIDGIVAAVMGLEKGLQGSGGGGEWGSFYDLPDEERAKYLFAM